MLREKLSYTYLYFWSPNVGWVSKPADPQSQKKGYPAETNGTFGQRQVTPKGRTVQSIAHHLQYFINPVADTPMHWHRFIPV